jgi:hypothetical protein
LRGSFVPNVIPSESSFLQILVATTYLEFFPCAFTFSEVVFWVEDAGTDGTAVGVDVLVLNIKLNLGAFITTNTPLT